MNGIIYRIFSDLFEFSKLLQYQIIDETFIKTLLAKKTKLYLSEEKFMVIMNEFFKLIDFYIVEEGIYGQSLDLVLALVQEFLSNTNTQELADGFRLPEYAALLEQYRQGVLGVATQVYHLHVGSKAEI